MALHKYFKSDTICGLQKNYESDLQLFLFILFVVLFINIKNLLNIEQV